MSFKSEPVGECEENCKTGTISPTTPPVLDEAAAARLEILTQDLFSNLLEGNLEEFGLLRASSVCKGWRIFCREALREDHGVMAVIPGTCHDLKTFSLLLETSASLPFEGLSVTIQRRLSHRCLPTDEKEALEIASTIAVGMDVKCMSITVDGPWRKFDSQCGSVGIIREILKESAESLEELRFVFPQIWCVEWGYWKLLGINHTIIA